MFLSELDRPTLIVIYPGRFQPFHKGHHAVYEYLTGKFGRNNVWIATSNKTDGQKSPFSFAEKLYFMQLTGVPADRVIQAAQPYKIEDVIASGGLQIADPANTVAIFAVSEKDMDEDPRFSFAPKKDGSAPFFQPLKDIKNTESIQQHAYIMTVPTFEFTVAGAPMRSATELRAEYRTADAEKKQQIIADLFGKYTREAEQIMNEKLPPVNQENSNMPVATDSTSPVGGGGNVREDAAGVGVVAKNKRQSRDPRYSMSWSVDVNASTPGKNLRAFRLKEHQELDAEIARLLDRINSEPLSADYREKIKDRVEQLKQVRSRLSGHAGT